ncbi:SapC family protein [Steroidobacter sp.]|uniref:SapC family protein n=1 Tax=Steroidobacter sp. TaxID=1978227 RepID=UPI001A3FEC15|nr:SapC family protein [Steroidobacter sp.]MBL8265631.1 SapC family protein [Steroidobacter sp.]
MTQHALLNNLDHKALRVITTRGAEYGDNVMLALTFPAEFRNLQAHYPVVFRKNAQGQFEPVALLGFKDGQNLFLTRQGWDATYIPLTIERQPFLIGFSADRQPMIHIDLDSPRVSREQGEPIFRDFGGNTEFLERMNSVLLAIHDGLAGNESFIGALLQHELLESFVFDITLNDGSQNRLAGFYTINEERLLQLNGDALERLNRAGHLQAIYMTIASLSNFRALIERVNTLNAGDR